MGGVQDQESLQKASPKSTINFTDTNNNKSQKNQKGKQSFRQMLDSMAFAHCNQLVLETFSIFLLHLIGSRQKESTK